MSKAIYLDPSTKDVLIFDSLDCIDLDVIETRTNNVYRSDDELVALASFVAKRKGYTFNVKFYREMWKEQEEEADARIERTRGRG